MCTDAWIFSVSETEKHFRRRVFSQHLIASGHWHLSACLIWSCIQGAHEQVREWHSKKALSRLTIVAKTRWREGNDGARRSALTCNNCVLTQAGVSARSDPNPKPFIHHLSTFFPCKLTWTDEQHILRTDIHPAFRVMRWKRMQLPLMGRVRWVMTGMMGWWLEVDIYNQMVLFNGPVPFNTHFVAAS